MIINFMVRWLHTVRRKQCFDTLSSCRVFVQIESPAVADGWLNFPICPPRGWLVLSMWKPNAMCVDVELKNNPYANKIDVVEGK